MKKILKAIIAVVLSATCMMQPCYASAASFAGKTYVKEMMISYGKTADAAKKWLTDKGYTIIDYNINEGADDAISTKRAVYLGYKTTKNADEAITDMKLMNMTGGYSVLDYQMLLKDQANNINTFLSNFITAINEYRENYKAGKESAVAAYEMLNLIYDDDTEEYLGDLFLEKIKQEYTDEEFAALSKAEQSKHADMTTIIMQGNSAAVLAIEQLIAIGTDTSDSLWTERYKSAPTYDEMVEELTDSGLTVAEAVKKLSAEFDGDAQAIASKLEAYKEYLSAYEDEEISLQSTEAELTAYEEEAGCTDTSAVITAGVQYEILKSLVNEDGDSLLDILTGDDLNLAESNEYRYMLYPLISVLSDGQRACLDFLPMYQLVSIGINDGSAVKSAAESLGAGKESTETISVYDGVDRSIYSSDVAMTGEAYALQNSSTKEVSDRWFDNAISDTTKTLYFILGCSIMATVLTFTFGKIFESASTRAAELFADSLEKNLAPELTDFVFEEAEEGVEESADDITESFINENMGRTLSEIGSARNVARFLNYFSIGLATITIVIMAISLWSTYKDLVAYYNTTLTPIPCYMVNEEVNDNDEKVYTYYSAVKCNREESQFTTDRTALLKAYGDINGDVGKEWVALYTTTDKAAGDPITADFAVQYANYEIPGEMTPLSIFCNDSAQNLTNKKAGYTYADGKGGIYMFYGTDSTAFAGSAISNGTYALIGGGSLAVFAVITYFIKKNITKKKEKADA